MTQNVLQLWPEVFAIVAAIAVLLVFAVVISLPSRPKTLPGSKGHRGAGGQFDYEEIRADGYIDSFGKEIEEAGGGLPLIVKLALPGVLLWWLIYLILNWTKR
jgi:hypothetical protein